METAPTIWLTPRSMHKLQEEEQELKTMVSQLAHCLHDSLVVGETEEYKFELAEQRLLRSRLAHLQTILHHAKILFHRRKDGASLGNTAYLARHHTAYAVTLVDPLEADPVSGCVPVDSPLGTALLGKHAHDKVTASTPRSLMQYRIVKIE